MLRQIIARLHSRLPHMDDQLRLAVACLSLFWPALVLAADNGTDRETFPTPETIRLTSSHPVLSILPGPTLPGPTLPNSTFPDPTRASDFAVLVGGHGISWLTLPGDSGDVDPERSSSLDRLGNAVAKRGEDAVSLATKKVEFKIAAAVVLSQLRSAAKSSTTQPSGDQSSTTQSGSEPAGERPNGKAQFGGQPTAMAEEDPANRSWANLLFLVGSEEVIEGIAVAIGIQAADFLDAPLIGTQLGSDSSVSSKSSSGDHADRPSEDGDWRPQADTLLPAAREFWRHQTDRPLVSCASADGLLLSGDDSGRLQAMDAMQGKILWQEKLHAKWVTAVVASTAGELAASGDWGGKINVFHPETGQLMFDFQQHRDRITGLELVKPTSTGPIRLFSSSRDGTVRLWYPRQRRMVRFVQLDSPVVAIACQSPSRVWASTRDAQVHLLDMDRAQIIASYDSQMPYVQRLAIIGDWLILSDGLSQVVCVPHSHLTTSPTDRQ